MLKSVVAAAAFALMFATPVYADAPSTSTINDVRCLIVGLRFSNTLSSPQVQYAGKIVASYYYGRLKAEAPELNLQDQVDHETRAMTGDAIAAESTRCGAEYQTQSQHMVDLGNYLADRHQ